MGGEPQSSTDFPRCQFLKPHIFEKLLEESGMNIIKTESHEYPLYLSSSYDPSTLSCDIVCFPVRDYLSALVTSGEKPFAFEDAKSAFDEIRKKGVLLQTDSLGRDVIHDNRFKIIIARPCHDIGNISKTKNGMKKFPNKVKVLYPSSESSVREIHRMFNSLLVKTFQGAINSPLRHIEKRILKTSRLSASDGRKYKVLDLGSQPLPMIYDMMKHFPDIDFHVTSLSSDNLERIRNDVLKLGLKNCDTTVFDKNSFVYLENESIDMVICSLGLPFFPDIYPLIQEVYRVLKPGGTMVVSKWESLSLERIADALEEDFVNEYLYDQIPFRILSDHLSFSAPGCVENLLESYGLSIINIDHDEFPFILNGAGVLDEYAIRTSSLSIRHVLSDFVENDIHPSAFEDVKRSINKLMNSSELLNIDTKGRLVTVPNRIETISARKLY